MILFASTLEQSSKLKVGHIQDGLREGAERPMVGGLMLPPYMKGLLSMLTLSYAPGTCALAVHIALEDAGADYDLRRIDFASGEQQGPAFHGINPKGRVPVLETDRGVLTETPAILAWIAQTFPDAQLAPHDDPFGFARVQAFNSYLCSTVHVAHAHRLRGSRWADDPAAIEAMRKKVPESVGACCETIERHMLEGPGCSVTPTPSAIPTCSPSRGGSRATGSMSSGSRSWKRTSAGCRTVRKSRRR